MVKNGYEVFDRKVTFKDWWKDQNYSKDIKIFLKKEYSTKPYVFLVMNKIHNLAIKEEKSEDY